LSSLIDSDDYGDVETDYTEGLRGKRTGRRQLNSEKAKQLRSTRDQKQSHDPDQHDPFGVQTSATCNSGSLADFLEIQNGALLPIVPVAAVWIHLREFYSEFPAFAQLVYHLGMRRDETKLFAGLSQNSERLGAIAFSVAWREFQLLAYAARAQKRLAVGAVGVLVRHAAQFHGMMPAEAHHANRRAY
jgi:hypothetical protein